MSVEHFPINTCCTDEIHDLYRFWRIFWIDASSTDTMELSFTAIADDGEAKAAGVEKSANAALRWLSGTRRNWLLIFDNADGDPDDVEKYIPTGTGGNILFTSRNPNLSRFIPHEEAWSI